MKFWRFVICGFLSLLGIMVLPLGYHYFKGNLTISPMPPEQKADAVMVFTGSADRIVEGYQSYLDGLGSKIMITGTDYPRDAKDKEVRLLSRKIKKNNVYIDLKAKNTIENAENGAEWAVKNHIGSILLVTAEGHMPRAYFELRRLLPPDIKLYTSTVPGSPAYPGVDSEKTRLLCRLYETATDTSFCYKTRSLVRLLENHLG